VVVRRKPNWLAWRDIVVLLLLVAVILLVQQVTDLRRQLDATSAQRSREQTALVQAIDLLRGQLAVKDARIKQLTDQLLANGLKPVPAPSPTPQASPSPEPSETARPAPGPPHPPQRPSAHPSPRPPSPSPPCRVVLINACLP
jgi:hypothetical protein